MRVTIVGGGLGGTNLARSLSNAGHSVTLVDRDPAVASRGFQAHGLVVISGDGTDPRVLGDAEVGRADVVAAMLRRDADNLAVAAIARALGAKRILARLRDPSYRPIYQRWEIDEVFGEIETMVAALTVAIEHPRVRHSMVLGGGESIAFELVVPQGAMVDQKTVRDVAQSMGVPRGAIIAGIGGETGMEAPRGDSVLHAGRPVLVVARRDDVAATIELLTLGGRASRPIAPEGE